MKFFAVLLALCVLFQAVVADWQSEAKAVCDATNREADVNPLIKSQCKVRCTKRGEISRFENLPDGTECESIILRNKGSCKDGVCQ